MASACWGLELRAKGVAVSHFPVSLGKWELELRVRASPAVRNTTPDHAVGPSVVSSFLLTIPNTVEKDKQLKKAT